MPDTETETWQKLLDNFRSLMAKQIQRNSHKGMREAWIGQNLDTQLMSLQVSIGELRLALAYGIDVDDKAADCANWAFIIQDNFYHNPTLVGLPPTERFQV